ncbi:aminopeptidase P family protein [Ruminococcus gauvreauii]|uniref:aminopeptidase P family protein n=1 Tax=Ruminococcus gauvreauii TaxID=438033 RepID=UPI003983EC2B
MIKERLRQLGNEMKKRGIDYYIVPSDDYHGSEYVGEYFKCRQFITGFTGSAGTAVIWTDGAGLWTDGRYFLQAAEQLSGSGITLFKMGEDGVPDIPEFLKQRIKAGECLGVDGRTVSASWVKKLSEMLRKKGASIRTDADLIDRIWEDRPPRSCRPVWMLPEIPGESSRDKAELVRGDMKREGCDLLILSSLDEIAWLLNMRGNDTACCPVALAYAVVGMQETVLYLQREALTKEAETAFQKCGVCLHDYEQIYEELPAAVQGKVIWADYDQLNAALADRLKGAASVLQRESPVLNRKAVKSRNQLKRIRDAHLKDGIAVTRFLYWLKTHIGHERITEISAAKKLEEFRREQEGYLMPSFEPIMAYGKHGAVVHYSADEATDAELSAEGMLLMDTGGHYREGTTDITRTVSLGVPDAGQRMHYTMVLAGNLRLAAAKFPYGCSGENLDILARQPLWDAGLDYNHGTGHGVGDLLSVHEGPQAIRWRHIRGKDTVVLEAGMVISDEPGLYLHGKYGIRLENLLACEEKEKSEYGQFMGFEILTMVPFDRKSIEPGLLGDSDRKLLNDYHRRVYETLAPHLDQREAAWLEEITGEI